MPRILLVITTCLLFIGVGAGYFDEWWHADKRVETFFTLPHAILYASIFTNGMIVLLYVIYRTKKIGRFAPSLIPGSKGLALAGTGSLFQLCAGFFDMIYHDLVGFDVTIWSPPHLMAIFGGILSALGFAGLWRTVSVTGYVFSLAAAVNYGQFALSEYFVNGIGFPSRFSTAPAYYSILLVLIVSFVLTFSWFQVKKSLAGPILFISFCTQLVIWAMWIPTKLSITFSFPLFIFLGGIALDFMVGITRKNYKLAIASNSVISAFIVCITELSYFSVNLILFTVAGTLLAAGIGYGMASKMLEGEQYS